MGYHGMAPNDEQSIPVAKNYFGLVKILVNKLPPVSCKTTLRDTKRHDFTITKAQIIHRNLLNFAVPVKPPPETFSAFTNRTVHGRYSQAHVNGNHYRHS